MRMHALRGALTLGAALFFATALASCASSSQIVTVDHTERAVTIDEGDTLIIDFGEINSSVGDSWQIADAPDAAVLTSGEAHSEYLGEESMTGAPNLLTYTFEAVNTGSTIVSFDYFFRGAVPDEPTERRHAEIEVTVR